MPDDQAPDDAARLAQILADLAYFKKVHAQTALGGQPPTVYADKYVVDLEFLLALVNRAGTNPEPLPKTELERDLDHDAAGRVERRRPKP